MPLFNWSLLSSSISDAKENWTLPSQTSVVKLIPINTHIDNILKDAPTKLKVSVNVADVDWQKIQDLFDQEHKWMLAKMREHIREVNGMFVEERRRVQKRYNEYAGCYIGHYAQWFFFTIGFSVVAGGLAMLIAQYFAQ